jgi:predicted PurR-regulated permease PerM
MEIVLLAGIALAVLVAVAWIVMPFTVSKISSRIEFIESQSQKRHEELIETIKSLTSE